MSAYTQTLSTETGLSSVISRPGSATMGSKIYYSLGGSPEMWREEPNKLKLTITNSLTGRARLAKIIISDPRNIKESIYTPYKRICVVEPTTGLTIFLGRVEISEPSYESDYGQVLKITAKDYSYELMERKVSSDYSSSPGASKRSAIIDQLIQDYRYSASSITTNIEASGSSDTITRNYTKCGKTPYELIEELAKEDPWTDATWSGAGKVYTYISSSYTDETTDADDVGTADVPLMNGASDYLYLGQNNPFIGASFVLSTNGSYGTITWEYWNGAWTALTKLNSYDFTTNGEEKWSLPSDWATTTVNSTSGKYWVRCSVSAVTTQAIASTISCTRGFGYDFYVDDSQVFQYFRRSSKPSGGPSANGLTVALSEATTTSVRSMLHDYNFSEQPVEIITRVKVYGTDSTGTAVSYTATDSTLETSLSVIKIKEEFVWGAEMSNANLTTYCTNRAKALLNSRASDSLVRGEFKIFKYPYFGATGSETLVKAGDLIRIRCTPKSIDEDFLVLEITYEEPSFVTKIKVVSNIYGRSYSPFETASILQGLRSGADISFSSARIGDLMVDNAQIGSLSASKITSGTITSKTITLDGADSVACSINSVNKTTYADTDAGFWLGVDTDGVAKFNIGTATKYFKWDGSAVNIDGDLDLINGYIKIHGSLYTMYSSGANVNVQVGSISGSGASGSEVFVISGYSNSAGSGGIIQLKTGATSAHLILGINGASQACLYPSGNKNVDLGITTSYAFDDVYADDFVNETPNMIEPTKKNYLNMLNKIKNKNEDGRKVIAGGREFPLQEIPIKGKEIGGIRSSAFMELTLGCLTEIKNRLEKLENIK